MECIGPYEKSKLPHVPLEVKQFSIPKFKTECASMITYYNIINTNKTKNVEVTVLIIST